MKQKPSFNLSKQNALNKTDKSNATKWDEKIKPLCKKINSHSNLYTTSSCSGRITIIPDSSSKLKNGFFFKSHNRIKEEDIVSIIKNLKSTAWLRAEPAALHIAAKELSKAQELLSKIRNLGWKKSGIISTKDRYIIEAFAPEILVAPITSKTPKSYIQLLMQESNKKLRKTNQRIKDLEKIF